MQDRLVTAAEFLGMGDEARFELFCGVLYPYQMSFAYHGLSAGQFAEALCTWSDKELPGYLIIKGGLFLERDPDTVLAPDIGFIRKQRMPPRDELTGWLQVPPDAVVEIRSPANSAIPLEDKIEIYLSTGVGMVIAAFLDDRKLTVHTPGGPPESLVAGDTLDGREILPGLRVPVSTLLWD